MKQRQVYMEVDKNTYARTTQEHYPVPLGPTRQRQQGPSTDRRKRIHRNSDGLGYASTPIFCVLRTLLTLACTNGWIRLTGDISTAFLHAPAASSNSGPLHVPVKGVLQPGGQHRLETAERSESNLRTTQQSKSMAETSGLHRNTAEPNIYMTAARNCFVLAYVDDLLFHGEEQIVNKLCCFMEKISCFIPSVVFCCRVHRCCSRWVLEGFVLFVVLLPLHRNRL